MWPFDQLSARRSEIRRSKTERVGTWHSRLRESISSGWAAVMALTALSVCMILSAGGTQFALKTGQSAARALTSRVNFEVADTQQTSEMRMRARDASPNYYSLDDTLVEEIRGRLASALTAARATRDDASALRAACEKARLLIADDAALAELQRLAGLEDATEFTRAVDAAIAILREQPLVELDDAGVKRQAPRAVLLNAGDAREHSISTAQLAYASDRDSLARVAADAAAPFSIALRSTMQASIVAILDAPDAAQRKALYRTDHERTSAAALKAAESIPTQYRKYVENETLVDHGELTDAEIALLKLEHAAYLKQRLAANAWYVLPETFGRSVLSCLVVIGVLLYIARYQSGADSMPVRRAVSALLLMAILAFTRMVFVSTDAPAHVAIGSQALAAAMLAIVYRPGIVFAICGGLAVIMTMTVQQGIGFFVILLVVSGAFVFGLRDVRNRGRIVLVGLVAALLGGAAALCVGLIDGETSAYALREALWAAGAVVLAAFIIEGVLPGIERLFSLSTGMTLLEWCDANKPLMRMMAADAPGTYNHSLLVGALAESAAESIAADGLLARAGAYYHDIGKINKPEYFVENQTAGRPNRHERLSPAMSLLIIVNHVKDGIEMAKEWALPKALRSFIAEHHGTTLVEYFYHAATRQRRPDEREVSDDEYRYPGPKPQSKETAIVMLADGVEGAVRAMSEPTPGRIETVVSEIVRKRLTDGQFDECDLTFRELATIERSLVKSLCGIYHARITYPDLESDSEADTPQSPPVSPSRSAS